LFDWGFLVVAGVLELVFLLQVDVVFCPICEKMNSLWLLEFSIELGEEMG